MLHQHVVICVDRAGLVGEDGETHHGIFDVGFLRQAPGLMLLAPGSCLELQEMLYWAVAEQNGPVAIRYPRGGDRDYKDSAWAAGLQGNHNVHCHREGDALTLIAYGTMLQNVMDVAKLLEEKGIEAKVLRLLQLNPLPVREIIQAINPQAPVYIREEVSGNCGLKESIAWEIHKEFPDCVVDGLDLGHQYITHGSIPELYEYYGLSSRKIAEYILERQHEG